MKGRGGSLTCQENGIPPSSEISIQNLGWEPLKCGENPFLEMVSNPVFRVMEYCKKVKKKKKKSLWDEMFLFLSACCHFFLSPLR